MYAKKTFFAFALTAVLTASALAENLDGLDPYYDREGQPKSAATITPQAITGTRPTILSNLSVVATSATQMRVTGRLTTLSGGALAGMRVGAYAVGEAYFTRWYIAYTDNSGNFSFTTSKVPVGAKIQIEVEGNGAYNRPLPTFNRP